MTTTGTMRALDQTRGAVRVEDLYDTDIEDLWDACTTPERLARWIAEVSGELGLGCTIHATFTSTWAGAARIDVCDRPHHLVLTMEPGGEEESELEVWLTEEAAGTRLVVEERGFPLSLVTSYGAGWQAHLEDLRGSLAGEPSDWQARWSRLAPTYESMPIS